MSNYKLKSPLRYPGGKASLTGFITELAQNNGLQGGTYLELYAGGAGAALNLLFNKVFERIHINDYDFRIHSMWDCILNDTESFIHLIESTKIDMIEWQKQKSVYELGTGSNPLELGFATFFLNRTNRSGIIYKAGPIGGFSQTGNYLIDVRFNKKELISRIEKIAGFKAQIELTQLDAIKILSNLNTFYSDQSGIFLYLDPPYYFKGKQLYLNNYSHLDHMELGKVVGTLNSNLKWLISYDNVSEIRKIYREFRQSSFNLSYTLQSKKMGNELLVFSPSLLIGEKIVVNNRESEIILINSIEDE